MMMLGLISGGLYALAPLLLADRGMPPIGTAAAFLLAAAPQIVLGPYVGRLIDRRGPAGLIAGSFAAAAVFLAAMAWPHKAWAAGTLVALAALATFLTFGPISFAITHAPTTTDLVKAWPWLSRLPAGAWAPPSAPWLSRHSLKQRASPRR